MNKHNDNTLPKTGFLRLPEVLKLYPVSRATWYNGVKKGIYPQSVQLSDKIVAWRVEDIQKLINSVSGEQNA